MTRSNLDTNDVGAGVLPTQKLACTSLCTQKASAVHANPPADK